MVGKAKVRRVDFHTGKVTQVSISEILIYVEGLRNLSPSVIGRFCAEKHLYFLSFLVFVFAGYDRQIIVDSNKFKMLCLEVRLGL